MTVNEQLRNASEKVTQEVNSVPIPVPPSSAGRRLSVALAAGLIAILAIGAVVWLNPFGRSDPVAENPAVVDEVLVRDWVQGALTGRFDEIASLTYGESGEPEALAQLARSLYGYRSQFAEPEMAIAPFQTDGRDLSFICLTLDFGDLRVSGGMVVREWPDLGRKLWEFRSGMAGCVEDSSVTTTLPAAEGLGEWFRVADADTAFGGVGDQVVSGIAAGPSGFVAVGEDERTSSSEDDEAAVWISPTGTQWDRVESDASFVDSAMTDVVWFPGAELFVAVGHHVSDGAVWVSGDGGDWERVALLEFTEPPGRIEVDAITVGGPGLIAVGREWLSEGASIPAVWASSDGRQWNRTGDLSRFGAQAAMVDVVHHGTSIYTIGYVDQSEPAIWMSTDLLNWQLVPLDSQIAEDVVLSSIGSDQTALAVTGSSSAEDVDARIWTSSDSGQTWRARQQRALNVGIPALEDVTITPHGWLAVGKDGTTYRPTGAAVWMSVDGEVWQRYPTDSGALSPDPSAVAMITTVFGNQVAVAGGVTGETCVERFAQCDLNAAFWVWVP